jgi:hypothetical protein
VGRFAEEHEPGTTDAIHQRIEIGNRTKWLGCVAKVSGKARRHQLPLTTEITEGHGKPILPFVVPIHGEGTLHPRVKNKDIVLFPWSSAFSVVKHAGLIARARLASISFP